MTEIKLNRKDFIEALRIGGSMSGKSKAIAILDYAKIVIKGNVLKITSSDTECCIAHKMVMGYSVEGEHSFVVNPRDLSNALKSLKGDDVVVWINDSYLELKHAKGTMAIPTMPANEFPLPTLESECTIVEFESERLFKLLNRGKDFMSADELHPIMCGVYLFVNNECYGVASTDTHKLYTESVPMVSDKEVSAIVPAKAIPVLLDVINGTDKVSISFGSRSIVVKSDRSMVSVTLPTGAYPRYRNILPTTHTTEIRLSRAELIESLNRCKLFANSSGLAVFVMYFTSLAITTENYDLNKKAEETLLIDMYGDDLKIGCHIGKLISCLDALESEFVKIRFNGNNKAMKFIDENNLNKTIILMPMLCS